MSITFSTARVATRCGAQTDSDHDVITLRHSIADHLDSLADITGANVAAALTYNDPKSADLVLQALKAEPNIVAARIYDGRGRAFASYRRVLSGPLAHLPDLAPATGDQLERDRVTECAAIMLDGESIGTVYLVSDLQEIHRRLRRFIVFVLILMAASSAAAFLVALLLKRLISRPILDLVDGFNEMLTQIEVAQSALRAARDESELFINSVPSVLIGTDSFGQITRWNLAAATVTGLPSWAGRSRTVESTGRNRRPSISIHGSGLSGRRIART